MERLIWQESLSGCREVLVVEKYRLSRLDCAQIYKSIVQSDNHIHVQLCRHILPEAECKRKLPDFTMPPEVLVQTLQLVQPLQS